jgi:hypothetical protein
MIVFGLMETVKVYVDMSSDRDNFTLSEVKSRFVSSSMAKCSRLVDDHA